EDDHVLEPEDESFGNSPIQETEELHDRTPVWQQVEDGPTLEPQDDRTPVWQQVEDDHMGEPERQVEDEESYGHTSVWEPVDVDTALFVGAPRSPVHNEEAALEQQNAQALDEVLEEEEEEEDPSWHESEIQSFDDTLSSDQLSTAIQNAIELPMDGMESPEWLNREYPQDVDFPPADTTVAEAVPSPVTEAPLEEAPVFSPPPAGPFPPPLTLANENVEVEDAFDSPITPDNEDDSTAYLAYLQREPELQDGDTLNSLYDSYTDMAPSPKSATFSESPMSSASGPLLLRERVFTPPPPSSRLGHLYTNSNASSPITSLESVAKGMGSPASIASSSRQSLQVAEEDDNTFRQDIRDEPIRRPLPLDVSPATAITPAAPYTPNHIPAPPHTAPPLQPIITRPASSLLREPPASIHSIATPKPTLMFAIASDDVEEVRRVLENGDANPNEAVGPQSALQFALTNDQLTNKLDIVKTLLAFGADPKQLKGQPQQQRDTQEQEMKEESAGEGGSVEAKTQQTSLMEGMDPATRYFVERADAAHTRKTSKLIHRSFFRPLTRVRYDLVGQDRALEELFRLLSIHSRQISVTPVVVMFSVGSLLDVPTHTVNMVTVRSQDDLWESYSMNPIEEPTNCTLAEFLVNNEGKRCVVVLDEIEKVDNEKVLWSLLMPWEHGRCSFEAKSRHVDVRNVIWLCTSNIGQDLIFDHWTAREKPLEMLSRQEFLDLVALLRPRFFSDNLSLSRPSIIATGFGVVKDNLSSSVRSVYAG
ncbi:hypothetical protein EST38_g11489, partial [Candolleomyces aberdarensis]